MTEIKRVRPLSFMKVFRVSRFDYTFLSWRRNDKFYDECSLHVNTDPVMRLHVNTDLVTQLAQRIFTSGCDRVK